MNLGYAIRYVISKLLTGAPPLPPGIKIGKYVQINRTVALDWRFGKHITIGDYARIGYGSIILCHDGTRRYNHGLVKVSPTYIGERVTLGAYVIVKPGVKIGADAIVAGGAVVTKDVAPGDIVAGNPAKVIVAWKISTGSG